jgi:hypothetical protein
MTQTSVPIEPLTTPDPELARRPRPWLAALLSIVPGLGHPSGMATPFVLE